MKNYMTPCVTLVKLKEDVITASTTYITDNFDDVSEWEVEF